MRRLLPLLVVPLLAAPLVDAGLLDPFRAPAVGAGPGDDAGGDWTPEPRPVRWQSADAAGDYRVRFRCPGLNESVGAVSCPVLIIDEEDIMGQPRLVVDPKNPNYMGFHALHGGAGLRGPTAQPPPTERSRDNDVHQPHTTFVTSNLWANYVDHRYPAPPALERPGREVFGEDNAAVLDAQGRLYLASLYSHRDGAPTTLDHTVVVWKMKTLNIAPEYDNNLRFLHTATAGDTIDSLHLAYARETNRVAVLWRESSEAPSLPAGSLASWVEIAWTDPEAGAVWKRIDASQRVGPCRSITNPVAQGPLVYFGCFPDEGYAAPNATLPRLQLHVVDTRTWTTARVGEALHERGEAVLADRGGNHMLLAAAGVGGDGKPFAEFSYGEAGRAWSDLYDYGPQVTNATGTLQVREARVTAVTHVPDTSNVHFLYLERYARDPTDPADFGRPEFYKAFAAAHAFGEFLGKAPIEFGSPATYANFAVHLQGFGEGVFGDRHDDIVVWTGPDGARREFVAFGDYGYVRFAEVREEGGAFAPCCFAAQIPPFPTPAPGVNPVLVGAAAGALSAAMVARLLLTRRKHAAEAPSL